MEDALLVFLDLIQDSPLSAGSVGVPREKYLGLDLHPDTRLVSDDSLDAPSCSLSHVLRVVDSPYA